MSAVIELTHNKSGPGGATNTVIPGPNRYEGAAVDQCNYSTDGADSGDDLDRWAGNDTYPFGANSIEFRNALIRAAIEVAMQVGSERVANPIAAPIVPLDDPVGYLASGLIAKLDAWAARQ